MDDIVSGRWNAMTERRRALTEIVDADLRDETLKMEKFIDAINGSLTQHPADIIPFPRPYRVHIVDDAERADILNERLFR